MPHYCRLLLRFVLATALLATSSMGRAQDIGCADGKQNLLSLKNGGRIAAASSYHWAASIDEESGIGDHGLQLKPGNRDTVIFSFRDSRWGSFDCLVINLPPFQGASVPIVELATAQHLASGPYRLLGIFTPRAENLQGANLVLQFPKSSARFLRMKIAGATADAAVILGEIKLFGSIIPDTTPPPLPLRKHYDSNLIGYLPDNQGGSVAKTTGARWDGVIDGKEGFTGPFPIANKPQAVFDLAGGQRIVSGISIYIPQASRHNLREFEVLAGNDGPEGEFKSLGKFEVENLRYFHDPMQYFPVKETRATHIWILPLSTWGDELLYLREIRVHGK